VADDYPNLDLVRELGGRDSGLAVVITLRDDGSPHASVVNAGVLEHPVTGEPVIGFAVRGPRRKLAHLRVRPSATLIFRSGWEWVAAEGHTEIVGPDDKLAGFDAEDLLLLLRTIYAAAVGGEADDWRAMDVAMTSERHSAVLLRVDRTYTNPT
jgi:hypothetical protein